jgi:hypothetical protein
MSRYGFPIWVSLLRHNLEEAGMCATRQLGRREWGRLTPRHTPQVGEGEMEARARVCADELRLMGG